MNTSYREWYGVFPFMETTKTLDEGAKKYGRLKNFMDTNYWSQMGQIIKFSQILTMRSPIIPEPTDNIHTACSI